MLFPLPYKDELFVNARERGLDPYDVAALIRQESEFNPAARSPANAMGLMQIEPSTGRWLGRREGVAVPATSLFNPRVSIRLGTAYLQQQLSSWDGDWYRTLAAYNAGPNRVRQWLAGTNFREPIEFLESIPFTETREYIQAVMRNADLYRQIYSKWKAPALDFHQKAPTMQLASLLKPAASAAPPAKRVLTSSAKKSPPAKKAASKKSTTAQGSTTHTKRDPA